MVGGTLRNLRAATAGKVNIVNIYMDIYIYIYCCCVVVVCCDVMLCCCMKKF